MLPDQPRQILAIDQIHDVEVRAVGTARVVDGDDVRVGQPGERLHFPPEPLHRLRGLDERLRKQLHRDRAVHLAVNRLEHPPHPAAAKLVQQSRTRR